MIFKDRIIIAAIIIIAGYSAWGLLDTTSSNDMTLTNLKRTSLTISLSAANMAAILGAALFAITTCFTLSRDKRKKSYSLMDSSINSMQLYFIRVIALLVYSIITVALILVISFILQIAVVKASFNLSIFFFSYVFITLLAIVFSILLCSGVYLISESIDIVFLVFGLLFFGAMSSASHMFNWVGFPYSIYSDFAGIGPIANLIMYSRLFQIIIFSAIFILGLLCRRKYEFSVLKSFSLNIKSVKLTPIFICILIASSIVYTMEPYMQDENLTIKQVMGNYSINKNITLIETYPHAVLNKDGISITCDVNYIFTKNDNDKYVDFIRNTGLEVLALSVDGKGTPIISTGAEEIIRVPVPKGKKVDIRIKYQGKIKNANPAGFAGYICKESTYLLENSNWLFNPQTNISKNMKIEGSVRAPKNLTVVTVGKLESTREEDTYKVWSYTAESSEFNIGIFAGEYKIAKFKAGSVDVEFYYSPKHEGYIEKGKIKEQIGEMINYYEKSFGEYAFKGCPFKVVETSQYKTGGHSTQNVVTVAEYMFNREEATLDTSNIRGISTYIYYHDMEIIAHEVSHQWWGGGINISGSNSWFTEGLANYSSYLYMKNTFKVKGLEENTRRGWERAVYNPNKDYYKDNKLNERIPKDIQVKMGICDRSKNAYNKVPLELLRINDEGKCDVERKLSEVYKKYIMKPLTYNEFLDEMGIKRGEIKID